MNGRAFRLFAKTFRNRVRVAARHYPRGFWKQDLWLAALYVARQPYRVSRTYWDGVVPPPDTEDYRPDPHTYGETPLPTLETIVKRAGWGPDDTIYDLGCGRGKTTFFLEYMTGARVTGVDRVPTFVERGNALARNLDLTRVSFTNADLLEADYSDATALYYYGTCAHDFFIQLLIGRLAEQLAPGTSLVTVTWPLTNYRPDLFVLEASERLDFLWGKSDVYYQRFDPDRAGAISERPGRDLSRYPQTADEGDEHS